MSEPRFRTIYPDEKELEQIEKWDFEKQPVQDFLAEIKRLWHWSDTFFELERGYKNILGKPCWKLRLHTGGWSGNESIIEAMQKNFVFWTMAWESSRRGGHYEFEITIPLFKACKKTSPSFGPSGRD